MTGEANYNIDKDFSWGGQRSLFENDNKISKIELFTKELSDYIDKYKPDNIKLNVFCLINGFSPSKAGAILKSIQEKGNLLVWDIEKRNRHIEGPSIWDGPIVKTTSRWCVFAWRNNHEYKQD